MERTLYEIPWDMLVAGEIGRLQTLSWIPCVAGESVEFDSNLLVRLANLRRPMQVDAVVEVYAFFVKHRHIWPNFETFIRDGYNESLSWPSGTSIGIGEQSPGYLGCPKDTWKSNTVPRVLTAGYNRIWNQFFRMPFDPSELTDTELLEASQSESRYGKAVGFLKNFWNSGMDTTAMPADSTANVAISGGVMDIRDLSRVKAEHKSELEETWFGQKYEDLMKKRFGTKISDDANDRPRLIWRKSKSLAGYDVDGTSEASLGSYSGKSMVKIPFRFPSTFFEEHGALWIMCTVRWPAIHMEEKHYLADNVNPSYLDIAGDADIIGNTEPRQYQRQELFAGNTDTFSLGFFPEGQHYRFQPNYVHRTIQDAQGFPFLKNNINTYTERYYHTTSTYEDVFANTELGDYTVQGSVMMEKRSPVPPALASIYAGTR